MPDHPALHLLDRAATVADAHLWTGLAHDLRELAAQLQPTHIEPPREGVARTAICDALTGTTPDVDDPGCPLHRALERLDDLVCEHATDPDDAEALRLVAAELDRRGVELDELRADAQRLATECGLHRDGLAEMARVAADRERDLAGLERLLAAARAGHNQLIEDRDAARAEARALRAGAAEARALVLGIGARLVREQWDDELSDMWADRLRGWAIQLKHAADKLPTAVARPRRIPAGEPR